jgi:hypothetical protein
MSLHFINHHSSCQLPKLTHYEVKQKIGYPTETLKGKGGSIKVINILSIILFLNTFTPTSLGAADLILRDDFEEGASWTYGTHWNVAIKELSN